jgi:hypothetical protein
MIIPKNRFHLTYSCTYLELFLRGQSIQVHDLSKDEWLLFTERKWVESTHGSSDLQLLTLKIHRYFIQFQKNPFLGGNLLASYNPIFFWDVKAAPNYTKKLILTGIATITLAQKGSVVLS